MPDLPVLPGTLDTWLAQAIGAFVEQYYDPAKLQRTQKVIENGVAKGQTIAAGAQLESVLSLAESTPEILEKFLHWAETIVAPFMALFASHLLGVNVSSDDIRRAVRKEGGSPVANAVIATVMAGMHPPEGELQPSSAAAENFLGMLGSLTFQSWFEGVLLEHAISQIPGQEAIESTAELARDLINCLGLNRMARTALRPLVRTVIAQPLEWKVNKAYTPTLLSPASVVRQFLRGKWEWADVHEELARQGYSEARIDALLNEQKKFFSAGDVRTFVERGHWTKDRGLQHLRDQGYEEETAIDALRLEGLHRFEQLEGQEATALISAYASRDIDRGEFLAQLETNVSSPTERALFAELGELRRTLNVKPLSSGEVAAAVEAEILAFPDYVAALRREGYVEPAVTVKELLLRARIDTTRTIAQHRADVAAARALEQTQRDVEQKAKRAQVEADRVKKRRGSESDLERAAVIGLIPIARYEEVIASDYDADTVEIMVGLVEDERQKYLTQQQRAADAAQRVNRRGLDVGQLQQAVLSNLLTIPEFSARLTQLGFDPPDVSILAETLAVRKHDQDMARQKRDDAAAAAARRSIDLPKLETLVRKGIRPIDAYAAQLEALGYDEADRADLVALLEQRIAEDRAAETARRAQAEQADAGELTIDQFRRSVLLGLQSVSAFDLFLTKTGVNADVHALLVAELDDDLAQAEAARRRRDTAAATNGPRELPLDVVARAARLGIVSVSVYQDRLARAGYSPDDIALETELLTTEIADVQAARQQRDALPFTIGEKGLTLAQLAGAVKAGVRPLEDYRAAAITAGLRADAVETLVRVLGDELRETQAAKARREQIGSELDARGTSLAVLGEQVRSGALTLDAYFEQLVALGIAPEDADVLWTLLSDELAGGPVPA